MEYPDREAVSKDWKTPILTAVVTIAVSVVGYFSLTVKTNTERIIKLESQQVTPQGLTTESGGVRKDLNAKIDQVSQKVDNLRAEVKTDIKGLRAELKTDIKDLRTELKTDMKDLRTEVGVLRTRVDSGFQNINTKISDINKILLERLPPKKK